MDVVKFLLGLALPGIAAAFVWLLNIPRKDPNLFRLIDTALDRWISDVIRIDIVMGVITMAMHWRDTQGNLILGLLVVLIWYALARFRDSLVFLRKVAALGNDPADPSATEDIGQ